MWAILTKDELRFIYNSFNMKLKGISLFDLIHPEEIYLAKKDLCQFMKSKLLAGSVTKCRLKDYAQRHIHYASWIVVDIIMYVATEDLVLAFFHQEKDTMCGMIHSDIKQDILTSFQSFSLPNKPQQRMLYILDNQTKTMIQSWPEHCPHEILDDRPVSPGIVSCFRCVQQPFRMTRNGLHVQSLYIDYGSISFIITFIENKRSDIYKIPSKLSNHYRYSKNYFMEDIKSEEHRFYKCQSCGTQSSPEWRRGPSGHKTLCNACGLRYSRLMARQEKMAQQQRSTFPSISPQPSPSTSASFLDLPPFLCKYSPY